MPVITTAASSFGTDALPALQTTERQKAELASHSQAKRLSALPMRCRAWTDRVDLDALELMAAVAKAYDRESMSPIRIHLSTLARALKTDAPDAESRLSQLISVGAVERTNRLASDPIFRPCARGRGAVTKGEPLPDPSRLARNARGLGAPELIVMGGGEDRAEPPRKRPILDVVHLVMAQQPGRPTHHPPCQQARSNRTRGEAVKYRPDQVHHNL